MIQKFRWKFIGMSIVALFLVLVITLSALLGVSYTQSHSEVDRVLTVLVNNQGQLNPRNAKPVFGNQKDPINKNFLSGEYNPEAVFQYRYFTVANTRSNTPRIVNDDNVYDVGRSEILKTSKQIFKDKSTSGSIDIGNNQYAYRVGKSQEGYKFIVYLNESLIYHRFSLLVRVSIVLGIIALIVFALILILVSKKAIGPIITTYRKQREFITNAGHELKTPLAIISANTEMEEMLGNNSEWNKSTKEQVDRLTRLINRLIALARTGETGEVVLNRVNFSEIVKKNVTSFKSVMQQNDLKYNAMIMPDLYIKAESNILSELINILLDNARKYCDKDGEVRVSLVKGKLGTNAILKVANTYKEGKGKDYSHFFERFYREDESHNSKKPGFGIGLAMAQEIVQTFHGKIHVSHKDDMIVFTVILRLAK
ncbi:sensor histidine kinase [Lactobacillus taiwanensis]|uniref:sensor histidine kinase n=1 Tax=Lactobacillus taiwanensis TaxID=508451 RepID=UPI000EC49D9F|nr:HAMP domain-containing sensor histidine kinase [Lactobacillus taiwanensis]MRM98586.1 sensor histidine kinase [Lactobacillus taiwanensis]